MSPVVDILERQVAAAADLIVSLRSRVKSLERELMTANTTPVSPPPAPPPVSPDPALVGELERLRAERIAVRESIRGLLREIDRVPW